MNGGLRGLYDRHVLPWVIDQGCGSKPVSKQREKVVPQASGRVLGFALSFIDLPGEEIPLEDASVDTVVSPIGARRGSGGPDAPVRAGFAVFFLNASIVTPA